MIDREQIIQMAKEANKYASTQTGDSYDWQEVRDERFAALAYAAGQRDMRDAGIKKCRAEAERALFNFTNDLPQNESFWNGAEQMASSCAEAIRDLLIEGEKE